MTWLGLGPLQMAALWCAAAALATWMYLHTRRPQHRRVSTLNFWVSVQPGVQSRRRRLLEPWALLTQFLFLLLLIAALGNPRLGADSGGRGVVMVLDTSVWSQARVPDEPQWIDQIRQQAQTVLDALPSSDRVLLISTEPDAPPILQFTTDRAALRQAIAAAQPASYVANVPRALDTAKSALPGPQHGLLVYIGPGMLDEQQTRELEDFRRKTESPANSANQPQFLVRLAGGPTVVQNRGITRLSLRRDPSEPGLWHLLTQVKNYGASRTNVMLKLSMGGQSLGQQEIALTPGELANAENQFEWTQDGVVQAEITPADALDADNHASISLPAFRPARAALIATNSPFSSDVFSAIISDPYLQTEVVRPGDSPQNPPDVAIYESANPPSRLTFNSVWFLKGKPGRGSRPLRVTGWNLEHPVTRWVRTRDVSVRNPAALHVLPGDTVLATVESNPPAPAIVAREQDGHRLVIVGFDPDDSNFTQQSAFPLLVAGSIEWMSRSVDEAADSFLIGEMDVPSPVSRIIAPSGKDVPFVSNGASVHLFATEAGAYRILAPNGEKTILVNLPLLPAQRLQPTPSEAAAVETEPPLEASWDFWRWLAVLAAFALWLEWWLYYSSRRKRELSESSQSHGDAISANLHSNSEPAREHSGNRAVL